MLPELTQFEDTVTLVSNTGIQFMDFGLKLQANKEPSGQFVKVTNETVTLMAYNPEEDFFFYDKTPELISQNIVKGEPEYDVPLEQSLNLLNGHWLPLPFLRFIAPYRYDQGPANWARMRIVQLEEPDIDGNNYRLTIGFDTNLMPANEHASYLAPSDKDVNAGVTFKLTNTVELTNWFFTQEWVNSWMENIFLEASTHLDAQDIEDAIDRREPQAHLLNVLALICKTTVHKSSTQPKIEIPQVKIVNSDRTNLSPAIPVDLVLDVGNSRTCGILIENHGQAGSGLKNNYILQLRDLVRPECVYNHPFESRIEFAQAVFGKENFAVKSGRNNAFLWPTIARVGSEAGRLASLRRGTEGSTGLSSPKRYLWDESAYDHGWRFNCSFIKNDTEAHATAAPFSHLIDEYGEALFTLDELDRLPVFLPRYSRSSLMTFMLSEVIAQALCQINSPAQRSRQGLTHTPRRLNSITLTVPPGMAQAERAILQDRLNQAIGLVWKSLGWHKGDENPFKAPHDQSTGIDIPMPIVPLPQTRVEWDEASCGQLVYLYTEINENFASHPEEFFKAIARPDKELTAGKEKITLATIDIGGGTTDLVITDYRLDRAGGTSSGSNVHIVPKQRFRDSFKVAGDDIVLDVIQTFVLPSLSHALSNLGVREPESLMSVLCGNESVSTQNEIYRQQLTLQVFSPIALNILKTYEQFDPETPEGRRNFAFAELMQGSRASQEVQDFVLGAIRRNLGTADVSFDLHSVQLTVDLAKLHGMFLSRDVTIMDALSSLCEVITQYPCDVLLLTGRPSRLPGVQAFLRKNLPLPPGRIIPMQSYHTGGWYPFHRNGMIDDPKTTASVGAMLCLLAANHNIQNFYFRSIDLKPYSTIRYFGIIDKDNYIGQGDVLYNNIKTQDNAIVLPTVDGTEDGETPQLELRGDIRLGFRQLPIKRWSASPLYTLRFTPQGKEKYNRASAQSNDLPVLRVRLKVSAKESEKKMGIISDRLVIDRVECNVQTSFNARADLKLELNTMLDSDMSDTNYWLDSGSVKRK
ncbi:virulence factor SrfB [Pseudomonas sp. F1_0610]|uniref:virulence factor SrfB n=1 Tax=Pseudomonas sp. F1_0610 TaxID=3114284 RepID=UPI0039C06518